MAKYFRLQPLGHDRCESILRRGQYADYPVGRVCKIESGWMYGYVGTRTLLGPAKTKKAAIKAALRGYQTYIGRRSALHFEGARARRRVKQK
jgi:hypothetical protein